MANDVSSAHRIVGKWYNGLGNGQYIRFQFTDACGDAYTSPFASIAGSYGVEDDQLTRIPSGSQAEVHTSWFECIGTGSFSEYRTLRSNATHLETPYTRDPTDPRRFCEYTRKQAPAANENGRRSARSPVCIAIEPRTDQ